MDVTDEVNATTGTGQGALGNGKDDGGRGEGLKAKR